MRSITIQAPAKVNLYLKILGKRKDSYHNILTIFERLSLADTIKISKAPKGIMIKSDVPITKDPKDNLVYKAAKLILEHSKIKFGAKIEIKKRIPIASGLGGGSSDAAAVLRGMNRLFCLRLNDKTLLNMAKTLGADVPFFILDTAFAIGKGRGDELKVIRSKSRFWHLIIKTGSKTATKDVYRAFDRASKHLTPQGESARIQLPSKLQMGYAYAESMLHNDLERVVSLKKSVIGKISKSLAQLLGKKTIISGSGPSLFCLYKTGREAMKAKDTVLRSVSARSRTGWQIFVVKTE